MNINRWESPANTISQQVTGEVIPAITFAASKFQVANRHLKSVQISVDQTRNVTLY